MLDAVVQMVRNGLCCIKDLSLFQETKLQDPAYTALYYDFPEPLNKTTPLELLISTTQLYAVLSTTRSGIRLMTESGHGKLRRITQLQEIQANHTPSSASLSNKIITESLQEERHAALRSILIGFNLMCIGISFFWLFANSLHVTETNWIGGAQGLIHALTVMEVCLVPLLYFMFQDGFSQVAKSKRMQELVLVLERCGGCVPAEVLNAETYSWIVNNGWEPFWAHEYGVLEPLPNELVEMKHLDEETLKLNTTLNALTGKGGAKEEKAAKMATALQKTANRLSTQVSMLRMEGYRELLYFVINWIAFYGYLVGIMVFYYEIEEEQHYAVRSLKFGMANADADWHGNFAGDLMWTIEPMIILTSPMLMTAWMSKPSVVVKPKTE